MRLGLGFFYCLLNGYEKPPLLTTLGFLALHILPKKLKYKSERGMNLVYIQNLFITLFLDSTCNILKPYFLRYYNYSGCIS